jgi:hypothetical protein
VEAGTAKVVPGQCTRPVRGVDRLYPVKPMGTSASVVRYPAALSPEFGA